MAVVPSAAPEVFEAAVAWAGREDEAAEAAAGMDGSVVVGVGAR